jgi:mRNA interferase RelE/StbE
VPYTIEFRPAARRDLKALPREILQRISKKIDSLADAPRPPGVEKLSGSEDSYRVRVGDYRILYEIRDEVLLVIIVRVRHRREAYRN